MNLQDLHRSQGANLAADGIPLHYGDLKTEYHAALEKAVLLDRSHEGRLALSGIDRFNMPHRISTNDLLNMAAGEGRPTIFTNPVGRILDRVIVYNRENEALMLGGPGRSEALRNYLQRNIFFKDQVQLHPLTDKTNQFTLHGPQADTVIETIAPGSTQLKPLFGAEITIAGVPVFLARRKPLCGTHWVIVSPAESSSQVWTAISEIGLIPAGSLTYNTLRIRAGYPAGREVSTDYIPLEVGLWDEVSFSKGCYTGQEILARMESRNRLAKTLVTLQLNEFVEAPAAIFYEKKQIGTLTSSVVSPNDEIFAMGVIKPTVAEPGQQLTIGKASIPTTVIALAGVQPASSTGTEN
jgi:tRNA-modifying protein YgfZ